MGALEEDNMKKSNIKCRKYDATKNSCLGCDLLTDKKCNLEFDIEIPKKYITVERRDRPNISWNECPTCGCVIGYRPDIKDFRCPRCGQRIIWA